MQEETFDILMGYEDRKMSQRILLRGRKTFLELHKVTEN